MKNYSICFSALYKKITAWTWQELLFGIKNNIILVKDIINYTNYIISEGYEDYDAIMPMLMGDVDEVESRVEKLALKEKKQNEDDIVSKWIFLIVYYYFESDRDHIFDMIDDIYCEFDYPTEMSGLVTYMPMEDGINIDDALIKYIKRGESIWFV